MVKLDMISALNGLVPVTVGALELTERQPEPMVSVMPYPGQAGACSEVLTKQIGVGLSDVASRVSHQNTHVVWMGLDQWFVTAPRLPDLAQYLAGIAAVTDQSDGWVEVILSGEQAEAVMARLCPLDLSAAVFPKEAAARTQVAHMMARVSRCEKGFQIMVMRSFGQTLVKHLSQAMMSVSAQVRI